VPTVRLPQLVIGVLAQVTVLLLLSEAVGLSAAGWVLGVVYGVLLNTLLARALATSGDRLGPADLVTLVRATLIGGVLAMVFARPEHTAVLVPLVLVALAGDFVDGWVARRTGTASGTGARFDMEVDAFAIMVLSVYATRVTGPWVLLLGLARYVFVAAGWVLPWMRAQLPPRYWRKVVAAVVGIALAAALLPNRWTTLSLVVATALLAESFGRDVWWLWRRPAASRVNREGIPTRVGSGHATTR
jgi:phosphatidylglycerophosphate synthase